MGMSIQVMVATFKTNDIYNVKIQYINFIGGAAFKLMVYVHG